MAIEAVALCTVIGPVSVGLLVMRVKKLQQQRQEHGGGEDPLEFVAWYDLMTFPLNAMSGYHSAKAFVEVYPRILQGQATADRHSTGLGASSHREITYLDRHAVALICWYDHIQRLSLPRPGTEVARHDQGNAVFLPETSTLLIWGDRRERLGKLVISCSRFVGLC